MTGFVSVRRLVLLLATAPLLTALTVSAAGPKVTTAPKSTSSPIKVPATAAKMALIPPVTKEHKVAAARSGGIELDPGDIREPIRMSVRQPWADAYTSMYFHLAESVIPRERNGIAKLLPRGPGVPLIQGNIFNLEVTTAPTASSGVGVAFRASANQHYVVTCTFEGEGIFRADLITPDTKPEDDTKIPVAPHLGQLVTFIRKASTMRELAVQFSSDKAWSTSACEITPFGP